MRGFKLLNNVIIGVVCIAPAAMLFYNDYMSADRQVTYVNTVVLNNTINETDIIEPSDLSVISKDYREVEGIPNIITNPEDIIGKAATQKILKNTPLVEEFFEESKFSLANGEVIVTIPNDWIIEFPQSIRRGDTVHFYAVQTDDANMLFDSSKNLSKGKFVQSAVVMYSKDSNAREVVNTGSVDRYVNSSVISEISVKLSESDLFNLEKYIRDGYKFVIGYN